MNYDNTGLERLLRQRSASDLRPAGGPGCGDPEMLSAYAEGGLSPAARQRFQSHLATCGACRAAVVRLVRLAPDASAAAPSVVDSSTAGKRAFVFRWQFAMPALAALVLVGSIGYYEYQQARLKRAAHVVEVAEVASPAHQPDRASAELPATARPANAAETAESRARDERAVPRITRQPDAGRVATETRPAERLSSSKEKRQAQEAPQALAPERARQDAAAPTVVAGEAKKSGTQRAESQVRGGMVGGVLGGIIPANQPVAPAPPPPAPAAVGARAQMADAAGQTSAQVTNQAASQAMAGQAAAGQQAQRRTQTDVLLPQQVQTQAANLAPGQAPERQDLAQSNFAAAEQKQSQLQGLAQQQASGGGYSTRTNKTEQSKPGMLRAVPEAQAGTGGQAPQEPQARLKPLIAQASSKANRLDMKRATAGTNTYILTPQGTLIVERKDGRNAEGRTLVPPSASRILDFSAVGEDLWLLLPGGVVIHSANGGATWDAPVKTALPDATRINFTNASIGRISSASGAVLITSDGGRTWRTDRK